MDCMLGIWLKEGIMADMEARRAGSMFMEGGRREDDVEDDDEEKGGMPNGGPDVVALEGFNFFGLAGVPLARPAFCKEGELPFDGDSARFVPGVGARLPVSRCDV